MEKKKVKAVNKIRCHCVLDTESSTYSVSQRQQPRQAWKTLKPCGPLVQGDDTNLMGFTLIELLVVVLIIGILAAVALPQYQKAVWKSRYVQAKILAKSLADAEEIYYMANGKYTADIEELSVNVAANSTASNTNNTKTSLTFNWGYCTLFILDAGRNNIQCFVKKNGQDYLGYLQNFMHSEWAENFSSGDRLCISKDADNISNQICVADTHNTTKKTWDTNGYYWKY